jgi:crotonobetainyl-CoA:carnitine CoA-transferase CaiB-like acyl-CoA transferase
MWIAASEEHQQRALWRVLQREDLPEDPRFASEALRRANVAALQAEIEAILQLRPAHEWEDLLNEAGVPAMCVRSVPEALRMPQLASRSLFHTFDEIPGWNRPATVTMLPFGLSATPARLHSRPPLLGEHTDAVLQELGIGGEEIAALRALGVV